MSQCDKSLFFAPRTEWPESLPAVAVNQMVLAGFSQDLVFDHQIPVEQSEAIARLFRSLYFELSFVEVARLQSRAKAFAWFPISLIVQKFGWQPDDIFSAIAEQVLKTPEGFQRWAADKKLSPQDLQPLVSGGSLDLKYLFHEIVSLQMPKALGAKALELAIDLMLMGRTANDIGSEVLVPHLPSDLSLSEAWVLRLTELRHPELFKQDQEAQAQMASLPWPGTTEARWIRQGERSGIELKLFVSKPSDLKKYLQGLSHVQDLMEKTPSGTKH